MIELSIVLLMAGAITVPAYSYLMRISQVKTDRDKIAIIQTALAEHVRLYGFYPCPARMNAQRTDADYATADCVNTTNVAGMNPNPPNAFAPVFLGAVPINNLQGVMDCQSFDVGIQDTNPVQNRPVAATATQFGVPNFLYATFRKSLLKANNMFRPAVDVASGAAGQENTTLDRVNCIEQGDMLDEHGHKFLYGVSRPSTTTSSSNNDPFNPLNAQIRVNNRNGNQVTANFLHYIIVSFGKDGRGGVDQNGQIGIPCAGGLLEDENCDNANAVFISTPYDGTEVAGTMGVNFDDMVEFSLAGRMHENEMWDWSPVVGDFTNRNVYFNQRTRSVLTIDGLPAQPNDLVTVNRGDMQTSGALLTQSNIRSNTGDIVAPNGEVRAGLTGVSTSSIQSPRFCYDIDCDGP